MLNCRASGFLSYATIRNAGLRISNPNLFLPAAAADSCAGDLSPYNASPSRPAGNRDQQLEIRCRCSRRDLADLLARR